MEPKDLQLIEQYIDGALDEKDLADFHARMEKDTEFAQAVQMEKDIFQSLELLGNKELKKQLEKIGKEETGGAKIKNINNGRRRLIWAAAAVLGIAVIAKFALGTSKLSPEKLYAQYAVHEFDFTQMSGTGNNLPEIERLLKDEKYKDAIPLMENHLSNNAQDYEIKMALGISFLENNQYQGAHTIFNSIINEVPTLKYDATWYNALAFLKNKEIEKCRSELKKIPESSARFRIAQKLLSDL